MKIRILQSMSTLNGTFHGGQVVEVEQGLAESWVKGRFAALVGDVVVVTPPPVPVVPPVPAPLPVVKPVAVKAKRK